MTDEEYWKIQGAQSREAQIAAAKALGYDVEIVEDGDPGSSYRRLLVKKGEKPIISALYLSFVIESQPDIALQFYPYSSN